MQFRIDALASRVPDEIVESARDAGRVAGKVAVERRRAQTSKPATRIHAAEADVVMLYDGSGCTVGGAPRCFSETVVGRLVAWTLPDSAGSAAVFADFMPALRTCRSYHAPACTVEHVSHDSCTCSRCSSLQG